jgi:hypothetical protein
VLHSIPVWRSPSHPVASILSDSRRMHHVSYPHRQSERLGPNEWHMAIETAGCLSLRRAWSYGYRTHQDCGLYAAMQVTYDGELGCINARPAIINSENNKSVTEVKWSNTTQHVRRATQHLSNAIVSHPIPPASDPCSAFGHSRKMSDAHTPTPTPLRALAAETTGELEVLGLDGNSLGVDRGKVGVLELGGGGGSAVVVVREICVHSRETRGRPRKPPGEP